MEILDKLFQFEKNTFRVYFFCSIEKYHNYKILVCYVSAICDIKLG